MARSSHKLGLARGKVTLEEVGQESRPSRGKEQVVYLSEISKQTNTAPRPAGFFPAPQTAAFPEMDHPNFMPRVGNQSEKVDPSLLDSKVQVGHIWRRLKRAGQRLSTSPNQMMTQHSCTIPPSLGNAEYSPPQLCSLGDAAQMRVFTRGGTRRGEEAITCTTKLRPCRQHSLRWLPNISAASFFFLVASLVTIRRQKQCTPRSVSTPLSPSPSRCSSKTSRFLSRRKGEAVLRLYSVSYLAYSAAKATGLSAWLHLRFCLHENVCI